MPMTGSFAASKFRQTPLEVAKQFVESIYVQRGIDVPQITALDAAIMRDPRISRHGWYATLMWSSACGESVLELAPPNAFIPERLTGNGMMLNYYGPFHFAAKDGDLLDLVIREEIIRQIEGENEEPGYEEG